VRAVSNFTRPSMYPTTLLLMIAWISSLAIMGFKIMITSVKSALVGWLNKLKSFSRKHPLTTNWFVRKFQCVLQ